MKTLIAVLIIAAFLQTTILAMDLVLLILICRSYIKSGRENLYLASGYGLLVGHLSLTPLGLTSLIYLASVEITQILSKIRLAGNPLFILPISLIFLLLNQIASSPGHISIEFSTLILASFLSLPILFLVRLWEERFVIRKEIKLKF